MPTVPCTGCRSPLDLSHDSVRALVDTGKAAACGRCRKAPIYFGTKAHKLLWAAVERFGGGEWDFGHLTVVAWQQFPEAFGIVGIDADHPDTNRVAMELPKMKAHKWIESAGPRRYRVTAAGRAAVKQYEG